MYGLKLNDIAGGEETLNSIVEDIRDILDNNINALVHFEETLQHSGYFDIHYEYYEKFGYQTIHEYLFTIKDDFPRILSKNLLPGVGDIKYSIALSNCLPFEVEIEDFKVFLETKK